MCADVLITARPVSRTSKLMSNFTMNQPNGPSRSTGADVRHDSQPIDPLSHVRSAPPPSRKLVIH